MKRFNFFLISALLAGLGLGLVYSWLISPVTYVDANPAILRADFKDQYRIVIAAAYDTTHNLPRARARLELLGDADPVGELSAQAQRMLASGESFEHVRPLAQLATDLQQGYASVTNAPASQPTSTQISMQDFETPAIEANTTTIPTDAIPLNATAEPIFTQSSPSNETPLAPQANFTPTPRPTFTPVPPPGAPFTLVGQDTICNPDLPRGLLQITLMDSRGRQKPGIKIVVTWDQGEDQFFTGLKSELGDGYADFVMKADTIYNVQIADGGAFVANISAPACTDDNGASYLGGLALTFQQ